MSAVVAPRPHRGDVFWANLDPTIGVEIKKTRPVLVLSNDFINTTAGLSSWRR